MGKSPDMPLGSITTPPLVGRRGELDRALAALDRFDGVLVRGVAGIGKSMLLEGIEAQSAAGAGHTIHLRATEATSTISMWPFRHLLPDAPPTELLDLARHVRHHLLELARGRRLVLFVDDVQHLDDPSIGMLDHLLDGGHIRLVASIRSGETYPSALDSLWSRFAFGEITLEPLGVTEGALLVEKMLGDPVDAGSVRRLTDFAGGNPLLLRELVLDAVENGSLGRSGGAWRLAPTTSVATQAIGERTRLCVRRRLARLDRAERDLLALIAVAGEIRPQLVPEHLTGALPSLEARRLATVQSDHPTDWRVRIDHPLLAEVVTRSMTGSARRESLRMLVVSTRRANPAMPGDATRLAVWAEAGDEPLTAAEWRRATDEAIATFDHDAAERWAGRAVRADPTSFAAHLGLGCALRYQGRLPEALDAFATARRHATTDEETATAALQQALVLALPMQRPRDAIRILREVEADLTDETHAWSVRSEAAVLATLLGEFDDVLFEAPPPIGADGSGDALRWQNGLNALYSRTMVGRLASIDDLVADTLHRFPSIAAQRPQELDFVLGLRGAARMLRGEGVVGRRELEAVVHKRREAGVYRGISAMILAFMEGTACHPGALATSMDAVEQHQWIDPLGTAPIALAIASMIAGATGDPATAAALAERGDRGSEPWRSIWVGRAKARASAAAGDLDVAARQCDDAATTALETSHIGYAALTAHDLVRLGAVHRAVELLDRIVAMTEGCDHVALLRDHAHALHNGDRAALVRCARAFADHGAPWSAAACRHDIAAIALAEGDEPGARRAVTVGDIAFDQLEPFIRHEAPAVPDAPSRREREVAALVVRGHSSAEVAAELGRSVRTVDNHLHRLYGKLEVRGRRELAALLAEHAPGGIGPDPSPPE